jgi:hypothetical protein
MLSALNAASNPLQFGMLIVDVGEVKLPGVAKQNNLPLECGQPIDGVDCAKLTLSPERVNQNYLLLKTSQY